MNNFQVHEPFFQIRDLYSKLTNFTRGREHSSNSGFKKIVKVFGTHGVFRVCGHFYKQEYTCSCVHGTTREPLVNERSFRSLATISVTWRALSHSPRVALWALPPDFFKFFRTRFRLFKRFFLGFLTFWFFTGLP